MLTVVFDNKNEAPMWTGWNSRQEKKIGRKKDYSVCSYLPQTNKFPTSHSVVVETLKRSLKIADKANRDIISVTCNLAIAKIALQV